MPARHEADRDADHQRCHERGGCDPPPVDAAPARVDDARRQVDGCLDEPEFWFVTVRGHVL